MKIWLVTLLCFAATVRSRKNSGENRGESAAREQFEEKAATPPFSNASSGSQKPSRDDSNARTESHNSGNTTADKIDSDIYPSLDSSNNSNPGGTTHDTHKTYITSTQKNYRSGEFSSDASELTMPAACAVLAGFMLIIIISIASFIREECCNADKTYDEEEDIELVVGNRIGASDEEKSDGNEEVNVINKAAEQIFVVPDRYPENPDQFGTHQFPPDPRYNADEQD